ncbi:MAG: peroxide stress protein YaaA [Berryella intestinalis]|uniref:peroxide stress protein YaaA n=1 Tax=Berryella intestinalis TaxID=1531429 RepID=UPI002A5313D2|nr:peroxide stress protein YaaA [Berryella intestinalis]MDD7368521.1 peroxide stress protein YaaA [Berryella intestinalis]MDY3129678.1 peroxide stress protein YaaA [Berryella intestinalis]
MIISPAKTMRTVDSLKAEGLPRLIGRSRAIAQALGALSKDELRSLWGCSDRLADEAFGYVRALEDGSWLDPSNSRLTPAVLSYDGLQYQSLAAHVMTRDELGYLQDHLRIVSGFYGVLRPLDGVVPYRLEMQAKLSVDGSGDLYGFWGADVFDLVAGDEDLVVNLASVEYAKAVTPWFKRGRNPRCHLVTCSFYEANAQGRLVQRAAHAKQARGTFVRWCAERGIERADELRAFDVGYRFDPARSSDDALAFVRMP